MKIWTIIIREDIMKNLSSHWLILILISLFLVACNREGVAGFSPDNRFVAVITNSGQLYTTNLDGTVVNVIEPRGINTNFDVSFDPASNRILYVSQNSICSALVNGTERLCPWLDMPAGATAGFLSFLPNGNFILVYQEGNQGHMRIYQSNGALIPQLNQGDIDHIFATANSYQVKRGSEGTEWFVTPHRATPQQPVRWAIIQGTRVRLYNASTTLEGPSDLGNLSENAVNLLQRRDIADMTSGLLSPDGSKVLLRIEDPQQRFNLYLIDLAVANSNPVTLVTNANFRVQYGFSPDGQEIVYESNVGGTSVWIANADGSNPRNLADNASFPDWH